MEIKPKKYKGIQLVYEIKEHRSSVSVMIKVSFTLNGTIYNNGTEILSSFSGEMIKEETGKLDNWAKQIIDNNIKK